MQIFAGEDVMRAADSESFSLEGGIGNGHAAVMESESFQVQGGTKWTQMGGLDSEEFQIHEREADAPAEGPVQENQAGNSGQGSGSSGGSGGGAGSQHLQQGSAPKQPPEEELIEEQGQEDLRGSAPEKNREPSVHEGAKPLNNSTDEQRVENLVNQELTISAPSEKLRGEMLQKMSAALRSISSPNTTLAYVTSGEAAIALRLAAISRYEFAFSTLPAYETPATFALPRTLGMRIGSMQLTWLLGPLTSLLSRKKKSRLLVIT